MKTTWLHDLFDLFFPNLCFACQKRELQKNAVLCYACHRSLPTTDMHTMKENRFTDRFFGRVYLQAGAALYHFKEDTAVQQLIHQFKYEDKPKIGRILGEQYGHQLMKNEQFSSVDLIVPVPLHPKKERQRGYNQSDFFAKGLANSMKKPWLKTGLKRTKYGESQTRKSQTDRFQNVLESFDLRDNAALEGKHILIVDDVLTTGATLEACASKVLSLPNTKVSMATIAIAGTI
ncbi:MAG: ComF family protein [Bacteroidota bacterium]